MPRFSDKWVIDKSLFQYTTGGDCACCSFPNLFNPEGLQGLINAVSDLETDAANAEYQAAQNSPWPPEMRDGVWSDRVRLRHFMKKEMGMYKSFAKDHMITKLAAQSLKDGCETTNDGNSIDKPSFEDWCINSVGAIALKKIFQMPRSEVIDQLKERYTIQNHSAFGIVLTSVTEQVSNFKVTKLDTDARGPAEILFEEALGYDRRGGFVLDVARKEKVQITDAAGGISEKWQWKVNEEVMNVFFSMIVAMGGPKLLQRGPSTSSSNANDDDESGNADDGPKNYNTEGPSFRSDRRIVRLLIARYWADQLLTKYKAYLTNPIESNDMNPAGCKAKKEEYEEIDDTKKDIVTEDVYYQQSAI